MEKDVFLNFLDLYQKKDRDGILNMLSDDVLVIDPHFPITSMKGKAEVKRGLNWSFSGIRSTELEVITLSVDDSTVYAEVDTTHHLKIGITYNYVQLLKVEILQESIKSISTYVQYPPGGIRGILRRAFGLSWSLKNWRITSHSIGRRDAPRRSSDAM